MTILELTRYFTLRSFTVYSAFVVRCLPARRTTAAWWTDTFGAEGYDSTLEMNISAIVQNPNVSYSEASSVADCLAQPLSFFWDGTNQQLYIHLSPHIMPTIDSFSSGATTGYTDRGVAYIDDVAYLPLLEGIPSLAQQADLKEYGQMAFISGAVDLINSGAQFDGIINDAIHNNDVFIYHLKNNKGTMHYSRSELVRLANLYVENYTFSLAKFSIDVQDKRKAMNAQLLDIDDDGKPYPLLYGSIAAAKATVVDDSGVPVVYRLAKHMTSLGTVQCLGEYGWTNAPVISSDLEAGTFTVSAIYARSPGNGIGADNGSVLECRLIGPEGIPNTSAADVIRDMNHRLLGIEYTSSNYDIDNWQVAESRLSPIGVLYTSQQEIYAAIADIQNACNLGFRYDIGPDGLRRIVFDDWDKEPVVHIPWHQIKDNLTLTARSDSTLLAASVVVKWGHDYYEDAWSTITDASAFDQVAMLYRQTPTMEIETFLTSGASAEQRAAFAVSRFSNVLVTCELTISGDEWFSLAIYDIITIELSTESRRYFGRWRAQILSVDPQLDALTTKISALLIERT